jgi:predicted O-linked N-acetylglucosamine transferase (SPINDLY family)
MILLPIVKAGWFGTAETQAAAATGAKITGISFTKAGISGMLAGIKVQIGWWPLLLIFAAIATAIGIIIGLMKVFESLSNAYNADAIAAEKAAEAARNLANAYGEAKDKYQEMVDTMDQYASAREALDSLTEGTQEYSEALSQANELALDLVANNPSLVSGEDYRWENGQLIIDEDALERVKKQEALEVAELKAASIMADAEAKIAKAKADQTALVRENNDEVMNAAGGIGTAAGMILSLIPAIGPAIGALVAGVGLLAGAVVNDF